MTTVTTSRSFQADITSAGEDAKVGTYLMPDSAAYRRAILALFCAGFSTFSLLYCVQPLLPVYSAYLHVSPALSSLTLSSTSFLLAISILAVGLRAERLARKPLMAWSLLISAALTVAAAFLPEWHALLVTRSLLGLALGGVPAIAMAYLSEEVHPEGLGLAMGVYIGGNAFGGMSGRFVTGLLADFFSWRIAMGSIGVLGLAAALLFMWLLPASSRFVPRPAATFTATRVALTAHLRDRRLLALFAISFCLMGSFVTIYNYVGYRLLGHPYDLNQSLVGAIFLVYIVGIFASAWFGRLADRHGRIRMLTIGIVLMLLGVLLTLAQPLVIVIAGIAMVTFGFFASHAVASGTVGALALSAKAQAASLYLLAYYLGASVMGSVGGTLWSHDGWRGVVLFVMLFNVLALMLAIWMSRRQLR